VIDDPMDAQLAALDPSRREAPPAPGSVRHASILERAMSGTDTDTTTLAPVPEPAPARRSSRRYRYVGAAAAAALVAVVAGAVLTGRGADDSDPISVVSSAAEATGEVTSFRASFEEETDYSVSTGTIEVNGDRFRVEVSDTSKEDGHVEGTTTIVIGRHAWEMLPDGSTHTSTSGGHTKSFGSSSQAVVAAALSGEDVAVVGRETVRGEPTTHFRITLDDTARSALAGLEQRTLGWFGLNFPVVVHTVDVWVGGDLIRRIQVETDYTSTTIEYYDFGAAIDIQAPDWAGR
jgi:hypothetical protein